MAINRASQNWPETSGYYVDCLLACIDDGLRPGNYLNAVADGILSAAQAHICETSNWHPRNWRVFDDTYDILATARGQLRRETPDNPYFA